MVDKICPNMKFIASLHHFPSTAKHLENIRLHGFLTSVNI